MTETVPLIPFNRPHMTGRELHNIAEAHVSGILAGDGPFTKRCEGWLQERIGCVRALLTHSCTGALEMAAMLLAVGPGDEVIMPSFTFVSTANAFVLRGATPVFVDCRPDTFNLDEDLVEQAITPRTKAIVVVHYAGVGCNMAVIGEIAERHGLAVVEDAAQGILATQGGKPLGSFGQLATLSFHETKNIGCGEGGALLINDPALIAAAEIIREKGTNRSQFFRGQVDKYTWVDVGSSYLPGEVSAAFLHAQLREAESITARRLDLWQRYHAALGPLEQAGHIRRPKIPNSAGQNGHIYHVLLKDEPTRAALIAHLKRVNILAVFHYVPLHNSPAGRHYGRTAGSLAVTEDISERLLRLPLYIDLGDGVDRVAAAVTEFFQG